MCGQTFEARGVYPAPTQAFRGVHAAMGTEFTIDLYAPTQEIAQQWLDISFDEIDRIDDLLSNYRPSSELCRISRIAGMAPVTTDPEVFAFLQRSFEWSRRSGGAFDMTVGPLMRIWGFFFNRGRVPSTSELEDLRPRIGWTHVVLDPSARTVFFTTHTSIELDPGGIGKGYAVDRVVALLREQHVKAALISGGSSTIYAIGTPPGRRGWQIAVPDPSQPEKTLATIDLIDGSLSTSSCTEKFFIQDGKRFCHLMDPRSMRPVEDMLQVTVIAPSAMDSDALTKPAFILGAGPTRKILQGIPGSAALIISGTLKHPVYSAIQWPSKVSHQ